jgi:outer membrane protein assembly complex protein YaeT
MKPAVLFALIVGLPVVFLFGQLENPQQPVQPESIKSNTPPPQASSRVRFVGNTRFTDKELSAAVADPLAAIQQQGLSLPLADDTAYYLGVFYRRHGFPSVDVKYKINGDILELDITEGPYYKLGEVYFEGNKTFQPTALKDYMVGTTRARYSQFQRELPFVEADLITGTSLLQSFYVSQGFPDVQIVKLATIPDQKRGAVNVVVTIKEGPRYFFGPITFNRDSGISKEEFAPKIAALTNPPKPYSAAELQNLQRDLTFLFKKRGHYEASVSVTPDFKRAHEGKVPITVDAIPGPIYQFGAIIQYQDPRARLRPQFLTNRFSGLRGQVYDPDKLTDLYTKLYLTGLFDALDVQEVAKPDHTIQLVLNPREARSKEYGAYAGYDTFDGILLGASYTNRNFDGWGRILSAFVDYTSRGPEGEVSYEDPWFRNSDIDFRVALGASSKSLIGYSIQKYYGRIAFTKTFRKEIKTSAFLEAKEANVTSIVIHPEDLVGPTSYQLVTIGLTQAFDFRDSPINPHKGWILDGSASFNESLDGSASFARFTGRLSTYVSFGKSLLALGARMGYISAVQGTSEVPIDERFFNGGSTTVRSFYETELSPKDTENHPIGGLARSIFNVEYNTPIYGDLIGAVFFDAGGTGETPFSNFATAVGGGVRYNLPIGPVRVDYGVNPAPRKNQSQSVVSLSFGVAF